jgi:hypothetical protein
MKTYIIAASLAITGVAQAQTFTDALRFSATQYGGTARFTAMGGSMSALGGDLSAISINPAGAAFFRKDEVSLTTGLNFNNTTSKYNGVTTTDSRVHANLGQLGYISANLISDTTNKWKSFSLGFNYNRNNNFYKNIAIAGPSSGSSLGDEFAMRAQGTVSTAFDPYTTGLAWKTYLIDSVPNKDATYFVNKPTQGINQEKYVSTKGTMSEFNGFLAGNYDNKLYVGASFGAQYVEYTETSTLREAKNTSDTTSVIKDMAYTENLYTSGRGWFLNVGAVYRPTSFLRIGASLRTPTYFSLKDAYSTSMTTNFTTKFPSSTKNFSATTDDLKYDYTLTTPMRATASIGFVINKIGLLNVDYEYVDYKKARFGPSKSFGTTNTQIATQGTTTQNIRIGGEVRVDKKFSIRGGVGMYGEAFAQNIKFSNYRMNYSGGVGYRTGRIIIDGAVQYGTSAQSYYMYSPTLVNTSNITASNVSAVLTLGLRF